MSLLGHSNSPQGKENCELILREGQTHSKEKNSNMQTKQNRYTAYTEVEMKPLGEMFQDWGSINLLGISSSVCPYSPLPEDK